MNGSDISAAVEFLSTLPSSPGTMEIGSWVVVRLDPIVGRPGMVGVTVWCAANCQNDQVAWMNAMTQGDGGIWALYLIDREGELLRTDMYTRMKRSYEHKINLKSRPLCHLLLSMMRYTALSLSKLGMDTAVTLVAHEDELEIPADVSRNVRFGVN
jgi:hypothetical protein